MISENEEKWQASVDWDWVKEQEDKWANEEKRLRDHAKICPEFQIVIDQLYDIKGIEIVPKNNDDYPLVFSANRITIHRYFHLCPCCGKKIEYTS